MIEIPTYGGYPAPRTTSPISHARETIIEPGRPTGGQGTPTWPRQAQAEFRARGLSNPAGCYHWFHFVRLPHPGRSCGFQPGSNPPLLIVAARFLRDTIQPIAP